MKGREWWIHRWNRHRLHLLRFTFVALLLCSLPLQNWFGVTGYYIKSAVLCCIDTAVAVWLFFTSRGYYRRIKRTRFWLKECERLAALRNALPPGTPIETINAFVLEEREAARRGLREFK